ncbi:MAG: acyl-CoA carboxylase subunit beta [Dehalococcoidales bacterium]|nr:acyl-CoA carboxylase subunit beta [Dehalococcoidales bacterium]
MQKRIDELRKLKETAALGGGAEKIARQHEKGKLTARERIDRLLDPGSFVETNMLVGHAVGAPADGIVVGHGTVDGRRVCVYAQDATVLGGSIGALHGYKMYTTVELALQMGVPVIGMLDGPGRRGNKLDASLRIDEPGGVDVVKYREEKDGSSIFFPNTQASGIIPQISAIMGSCAGISVYSPALTDFVFMIDNTSHMFITGPRIVKSVMGEEVTMEQLGGAKVHAQISGLASFRVKTEDDCFAQMKKLLSFLPSNSAESPPRQDSGDDPERRDDALAELVPVDSRKAYDMRRVIKSIVDKSDFLEVKAEFAPEIIVGFGRLDGYPAGIVANQPMVRAGSLTVNSSNKQARFIRFCDAFNIPLVFLVDTPAYMPGMEQEHGGIINHGAKVLYALAEATVPRVAVVIRKAYGGGALGMGVVPGMGTDFIYAWPIAETGVMGAEQTVDLFYADEIARSDKPEQLREQLVKEYTERYANPFFEASIRTHIKDVIEPRDTRWQIIKSLQLLRSKKVVRYPKRHGNIPL